MASRQFRGEGRQRASQLRKGIKGRAGEARAVQVRGAGRGRAAQVRAVEVRGARARPGALRAGAQARRTLEERSVPELRERARELEIRGRSRMKRDELLKAIRARGR